MKAIARGGTDDDENLVLACERCNLSKGTKSYKSFVEFARMAFWQPDEDWRASEWELDRIIDSYQLADPAWRVRDCVDLDTYKWRVDRTGLRIWVIDPQGEEPTGHTMVVAPLSLPEYPEQCRQEALKVLNLIEEMHSLLPKLVAEIRMLRAEVAQAADQTV